MPLKELSNTKSSNSKQLPEANSFDLKKFFGKEYTIAFDESYKYEKPEFRSPIEFYYTIPAKHGHFYPHDGSTIAFWCTANRIKGQILKFFKGWFWYSKIDPLGGQTATEK